MHPPERERGGKRTGISYLGQNGRGFNAAVGEKVAR